VNVVSAVLRFLETLLLGPDRAVANAREAATELARRRVEFHEVEQYLSEHRPRVTKSA
jgi:hypothetical protein